MQLNRPGFYVEGRYFATREAQARAFAQHRANCFGRDVEVRVRVSSASDLKRVVVCKPERRVAA